MPAITSDPGISLDGFIAGPDQSVENPLGVGGEGLHRWMFEQPDENAAEIDAICSAGAYIMGRNMFGPDRGDWDLDWHGWWGDDPPYHGPVFVLGHREREPVAMEGGTTFHFVTGGIEEALRLAREAAGRPAHLDLRRRLDDQPVPRRRVHRRATPPPRADRARPG